MLCIYIPGECIGEKSITARNAATKSKFHTLSPPISQRPFLFNLSPSLCPFSQSLVVLHVFWALNNSHWPPSTNPSDTRQGIYCHLVGFEYQQCRWCLMCYFSVVVVMPLTASTCTKFEKKTIISTL